MSFAFLPLYTGDYLRDTQHLSMSEHGSFLKLLMYCWDQKGPAPLDERRLMGICNARSTDEIEAMRRVLSEFFIAMDDGHYNRRMQLEIERSASISAARSVAGKLGYEAKAKLLLSKSQASAKQVPLPPPPQPSPPPPPHPPQTPDPANQIGAPNPVGSPHSVGKEITPVERVVARASRLALRTLPEEWEAWCIEKRADLKPTEVWERFRDYWTAVPGAKGRKLDWEATWRNWCRNEKPGAAQQAGTEKYRAQARRVIDLLNAKKEILDGGE